MTARKKTQPKIRGPYDRTRVFAKNDLPSLTEQSHRDTCDIKFIMRRFTQTGELPPSREQNILYGDAPEQDHDLHTQMNIMTKVSQAFENLPENVRANFAGPAEYFAALEDPNQEENLIKMGLLPPNKEDLSKQPPEPKANGDGEESS